MHWTLPRRPFGHTTLGVSQTQGALGTSEFQNIHFFRNKNGEVTFSIEAMPSIAAKPKGETSESTPARPETLELGLSENQRANSEFSELVPGSGLFLGSRHSLQGVSKNTFEKAIAANPKFAGRDFKVIGFRRGHQILDVLALVLFENSESREYVIPNLKAFLENDNLKIRVQSQDEFYSYQLDSQKTESFKQNSRGPIFQVSLNQSHFILPATAENYTSPGSSGALVFARSKSPNPDWRVAGIVECGLNPHTDESQQTRFQAIRVLTLDALRHSEAYEVDVGSLTQEPQIKDPLCIPLEGRGGGG